VDRLTVARRLVTASAILLVAIVALGGRLLAVNVLPIDYDEDDYLRAGQQYAMGLQAGDVGVLLRENYRSEHPPLSKIITGVVLAPLPPAPEIPDRPTTAEPAQSLPEPLLTAARTTQAVFGAATAVLLAFVSPIGGLYLALHTWSVKYTSQVMLEAVPAFFALLAVVLASRAWRTVLPGRRRAWLVAAGVAFGMACAGKYLYGVAGLAIAVDWLLRTRTTTMDGRRSAAALGRWALPVVAWLALGFVAFVAADPYLWPDPVGRLGASIAYHGGYATSAAVSDTGWPSWQPLVWLMGSVPWHDPGTFLVTADLFITGLAVVGLRQLWREHRVFALWLGIGFAFLLVWPTKWPQYVLVISAPLSLAAGMGTAIVLEPVRRWLRGLRRAPTPSEIARPTPTPRRGIRRGARDLRHAAPWLLPGAIGFALLALVPIVYEFFMSLTDLRIKNIRDGLQGGVIREAVGGLAGQIQAVPFDFDRATNQVQYVGTELLNGFQAGLWFGPNSTAAVITFSILWMVSSVALQAVVGIAVALVLERPGVRFANAWRVLFILPWAIPEAVGAIAWMDIAHPQQGLFSQLVGGDVPWQGSPELSLLVLLLAGTWMGWPLWMLVATAGLRTIPRSIHEAASIEGAGRWRTFASVTLPLLLPLLGAAFVVRGVAAFNQFYLFWILGPGFQTQTLATFSYSLFNSGSGPGLFAVSAAINIVTLVALVILVAWFLRWRSRAERVAFQ
jgi:ABC-type sugar transport system permease subunit